MTTEPLIIPSGTSFLDTVLLLHRAGMCRASRNLLNKAKKWARVRALPVEFVGTVQPSHELGRALAALVEGQL